MPLKNTYFITSYTVVNERRFKKYTNIEAVKRQT